MTYSQRYLRNRRIVRIIVWMIVGVFLTVLLGLTSQPGNASGVTSQPSTWKSQTWDNIQQFLHSHECAGSHKHHNYRCGHTFSKGGRQHWDGRFSFNEKTELCVEIFNGTRGDFRPLGLWDDALPGGGYLKVCQDGNYYYNDGVPFRHMQTW